MDKYYGNVCELDIIFSFTKAYYILDELLLAGELQESSKKNVLRCISQQDSLEDMEVRLYMWEDGVALPQTGITTSQIPTTPPFPFSPPPLPLSLSIEALSTRFSLALFLFRASAL